MPSSSLLKRIVGALRPEEALDIPEPEAFGLTESARARLDALGSGRGIVIGRRGPPADVIELTVREMASNQTVTVSGFEPERLRGMLLDWDASLAQWRFFVELSLRARGTPNPEGRLYTLSRRIARGPATFYTRGTVNPLLVQRLFEHPGIETLLLRGHTVTVNRAPEVDTWSGLDAHVDGTVRAYLLGAGAMLEASGRPHYRDPLEAQVAALLEERVLPAVHRDGGHLELVEVRDGVARLRMVGACRHCPSSERTLHRGVEAVLTRALPDQIRGVEAV